MELEIHEYQISILRELLFKPNSRFSQIKKVDVPNDHFTFHLNRLVTQGLVSKVGGRYSLTTEGKEFANRMDTDSLKLEKQAKVAVSIQAVRSNKGKIEYLLHQRLKEPFYGWWGSHTGKIRWGETPINAAKREFFEETGLTGDFALKGIVHYLHFHKDGRFLEDKYFFEFRVDNTKGDLKEKIEEGENKWLTRAEIKRIKNTFATLEEKEEIVNTKTFLYRDRERVVDSY